MKLPRFADNERCDSLATRLRKRRFELYKSLLRTVSRPINILDVGGTQLFWKMMEYDQEQDVHIVILNLKKIDTNRAGFSSIIGDARDMRSIKDNAFDIVFSNSVIEHLGDINSQRRMADEIQRIGKRYFIQTPNRYFPIEPHTVFPLFQFLPAFLKLLLLKNANLGWHKKARNVENARKVVESIRLLSKEEIRGIFPEARIYEEKMFGLTKSFIILGGWRSSELPDRLG